MAPNHERMSVMLRGVGKLRMLSRNSLVGLTPSLVTLKPRKLTSGEPNWNFFGLNVQPPQATNSRN